LENSWKKSVVDEFTEEPYLNSNIENEDEKKVA